MLDDVQIKDDIYLVGITKTKNSLPRSFTITSEMSKIVQKYIALRPNNIQTNRFFINYQHRKCTIQAIGINKFRKNPQRIAEYLKLESPESYTGHSFRRTSATVLVDAGADITALKRHGGWRSNSVAEGYINDSIANKNNTARKIATAIGFSNTEQEINNSTPVFINSESDVNTASTSEIQFDNNDNQIQIKSGNGATINISHCSNFTINFEKST